MAPTRKIPRKKLKQQDEFYGYSLKMLNWILTNWRYALAGLAFFLAVVFIVWGINTYLDSQINKSVVKYYQAINLYNQADSNSATLKEAREIFQQIRRSYSKDLALQGLLYLGHIDYMEGNFKQAVDNYLELYRRAGKKQSLKDLAVLGLSYSYESMKEYSKAISYLHEIINSSESILTDQAYLSLARSYEQMDNRDKAISIYQDALGKFPQAQWKNVIEAKIELLKNP